MLRLGNKGAASQQRAHSEPSLGGFIPYKQWGRMSSLRFETTAALPRLGTTSSVNVKRINFSMLIAVKS